MRVERLERRSDSSRGPVRKVIPCALPIAVAGLLLGASACSSGGSSKPTAGSGSPPVTTRMTVGYFPGVAATFFLDVAMKQGYFTQNNVSPQLISLTSGPALVSALAAHDVDIVDTGLSNLAPVISQGAIAAVALFGGQKANYSLVVQPTVPTPNAGVAFPAPIQDVKGLKIGVTGIGGVPDLFLNKVLESAGLNPSAVTAVSLGTAAAEVAAFKAKSVDGEVIYPPINSQLGTPGADYKVVADSLTGQNTAGLSGWLSEMWFSTSSWVSAHSPATTGFCKAMKSADDWASDPSNSQTVGALFAQWTGLPAGQGASAWLSVESVYQPLITSQVWSAQAPFAFPKGGQPSYSNGVDAECANVFSAAKG
jgi:NitT/TauT family transport system substrate-binding protein